ncbi:natterin-3-like isoform X2 [Lycorma delicatula]|uniref:natterin-3-like isoform X2 n=1 Tax=Lycorma delicatula TaxID=130591 RepID=UPI003F519F2F
MVVSTAGLKWCHPDKIKGTESLWVWSSDGEVPPNAVAGGFDDELLFVGRFVHKRALTPGKIIQSERVCCVPWGGKEHKSEEYEVLCGCNVIWVPHSQGSVPSEALLAGQSEHGEVLHIGRVKHNGATIIGKVQKSHYVCYIPYNGQEIPYSDYEVLVVKY